VRAVSGATGALPRGSSSAGAALAIVVLGAIPTPGAPQGLVGASEAGVVWETYRFADEEQIGISSLGLLTIPLGVSVDLTPALRLGISGAWARGTLERSDGSGETLSGPADTEIRLAATLGDDAITLSAVGLLPTGVKEMTSGEADLAGMLAADLLPFRITNWGSGGGLGASAALARPLGQYAVGASLGYVVAREFDPLAGSGLRYRPGNQLHLSAAVDRGVGSSGKGSISLSWQSFGADQGNGANLFHPGDRLQALVSYSFAVGPSGSGVAWGGWLHRGEGEFASGGRPEPVRELVFAGMGLRIPRESLVVMPLMDLRVQSATERDTGFVVGLGGSVEIPMGGVVGVPRVQARIGSVELGSGVGSGFVGVEVGLALRFGA
jgi:hypothetical protein